SSLVGGTSTYTATDTTDGLLLTQTATIVYTAPTPPAVGVSISPASTVLPAGGSIDVAVELTAPSQRAGAWGVDILYDSAALVATACSPIGSIGLNVCNSGFRSDTVRIGGASSSGVSGTVMLATITFQTQPGAAAGAFSLVTPC